MAGSLNHIIDYDGSFCTDFIENLRDAREALEECFTIIYALSDGDCNKISAVCKKYHYPDPWERHDENDLPVKKPMRIG